MASADSSRSTDVAIVGAGVSGCYAAFRLLQDCQYQKSNIALFEASDRIGGRLLSVNAPGSAQCPMEMGGMFLSNQHKVTYNLCRELDLPLSAVRLRSHLYYLRGQRVYGDPETADGFGYPLTASEARSAHWQLVFDAILQAIPEMQRCWPFRRSQNKQQTLEIMRNADVAGKRLYCWRFVDLLRHFLSEQAYQLVLDTTGNASQLGAMNAYDGILDFLHFRVGTWYQLDSGYQSLPTRLAERFVEAGGDVYRHHHLTDITRVGEDGEVHYQLTFHNRKTGLNESWKAEQVILALPKLPLQSLRFHQFDHLDQWRSQLQAIEGIAALKIFLSFDLPWWDSDLNHSDAVMSRTDLPLRYCFYIGQDSRSGQGILLASFTDEAFRSHWAEYLSPDTAGSVTQCPPAMLQSVLDQLSEMHSHAIPAPNSSFVFDWSHSDCGAAWHRWHPGAQSWLISRSVQRIASDERVFVCGEAYSEYQGWVEGALASCEQMLSGQMGLTILHRMQYK